MNYRNASNDIEVDNDIIRRVANFALYVSAVAAMKESAATPGHAQRVEFAKRVFERNVDIISVLYTLFTDSTLLGLTRAGQATDAQVQAAMDSVFNMLAGIST